MAHSPESTAERLETDRHTLKLEDKALTRAVAEDPAEPALLRRWARKLSTLDPDPAWRRFEDTPQPDGGLNLEGLTVLMPSGDDPEVPDPCR